MDRNENAGHLRDVQVSCGLQIPTKIPNNIVVSTHWAPRAIMTMEGNGAAIAGLSTDLNMFELGFVHICGDSLARATPQSPCSPSCHLLPVKKSSGLS